MTVETVLLILGSGTTSAVFLALINGYLNRRKLGAEATKVLTDAATVLVADLVADNARKDTRYQNFRKEVRRVLIEHDKWDKQVWLELKKLGVDIPKPPDMQYMLSLSEEDE